MAKKKLEGARACRRLLLALPVVFWQPCADAKGDLFFDEDLPMVASVSRLPQRLSETPAAVTIIDQEMIRASGMRTVEDLLRLVPGFQVTSHNQDPAIVTYHGLNSGMNSDEYGPRVQVLIDGRSQYSTLFKSGVNWNLLPVAMENIDRIEVTRGPNTVSYGSNAFMGVINIITLDPSLTKGWLFSANHGNNGIRDQTVRWGGGNENSNIRFTYKALEDDGFQKGSYSGQWTYAPDSRQSQLFDLRVDHQLNDSDDLQFSAARSRDVSLYGRPGSPVNDPLRTLEQTSTALALQWRRVLDAQEEVKLRYAFVEDWAYGPYKQQVKFDTNLASPKSVSYFQAYDPGGRSRTHELEFEHRLQPMKDIRAMWGLGAKDISLYSPAQFSTSEWKHRGNYRAFGNLEYRPQDDWLLNLGGSLENDSISGWMFDSRLGASYHLTPENTLRLVLSRAHRTPSLYEASGMVRKTDTLGTGLTNIDYLAQGVQPERIDSVELGYLGEFKALQASADVRAFVERIPNRILIVPLALPATMADDQDSTFARNLATTNPALGNAIFPYGRADGAINLEKVRIRGYEYQLRWRPLEGTRLIYSNAIVAIDANLTDPSLIAESTGENVEKISRQTRESAPMRTQSAMLIQQLPWEMQMSLMYFRNKSMRWRRNGDPIAPAERIDWRLAKPFKVGGVRGEVAYTMQAINGDQEGRQTLRIANKMQWLSVGFSF